MTNNDEAAPADSDGNGPKRSGRWSRATGDSNRSGAAQASASGGGAPGEAVQSAGAPRDDVRARPSGARSDRDGARWERGERRRPDDRRSSDRRDTARRDTPQGDRRDKPRRDDGRRAPADRRGGPRREERGRPARFSDPRRDGGSGAGAARGGRPDRGDDRAASADRAPRGPRSWDRSSPSKRSARDTRVEPPLPEEITGKELDRSVWREMRTLTKENAQGVAKHLVAAATLLEEDSDLALAHAEHAARRAGRVAAVREALGLVHYRRGEFNDAIREFRTAKRLSGSNHLLPYLVDCERGLGRYERALDLAASPEARSLGEADNIELAIVVSGVRRDLGQPEAAQMVLRIPALDRASKQPWAARLFYAYAEALLAGGSEDEARDWFGKALDADAEGQTDAADRVADLDGLVFIDALDEDHAVEDDDAAAVEAPEETQGAADDRDRPASAPDAVRPHTADPAVPDAATEDAGAADDVPAPGHLTFNDGNDDA